MLSNTHPAWHMHRFKRPDTGTELDVTAPLPPHFAQVRERARVRESEREQEREQEQEQQQQQQQQQQQHEQETGQVRLD